LKVNFLWTTDREADVIQSGVRFDEKWSRFATQMRDFRTIEVAGFATKMIPVLRPGFNWDSPISLIGVRAALEPSPAENRTDIYDDIILRCIDGTITQWVASTDPTKALVMTPIKGQKYAAQLSKGIYLFQRHLMHGKRPCLGQAEDVRIERLNHDGTVNHVEKGQFGVFIPEGRVWPHADLALVARSSRIRTAISVIRLGAISGYQFSTE
jgi:hypothetical protein